MNKRITCIALFENNDLEKIKDIVSQLDEDLNKVPFHIEERENLDTLPYHTTLCVWDIKEKKSVVELFTTIRMKEIILEIDDVKIKKGYQGENNSYNLYLSIKENQELYKIQKYLYNRLPNEKYNPDKYDLHISLHSDNNYDKLLKMKKELLENFQGFKIRFKKLGLFEIYPAEKIL